MLRPADYLPWSLSALVFVCLLCFTFLHHDSQARFQRLMEEATAKCLQARTSEYEQVVGAWRRAAQRVAREQEATLNQSKELVRDLMSLKEGRLVPSSSTPLPAVPSSAAGLSAERVETCFQKVWSQIDQFESMMKIERRFATLWLAKQILLRGLRGDFIEAGVANGGGACMIQSLLSCVGDRRDFYLADSWQGLPTPSKTSFSKEPSQFRGGEFYVPFARFVKEWEGWERNWTREGFEWPRLNGGTAKVLKGEFQATLPRLRDENVSLSYVKCDGDMYSSTFECVQFLYPRLECGGYIYFDDYHEFGECQRAVKDYLTQTNQQDVAEDMFSVRQGFGLGVYDRTLTKAKYEAVFWRKECERKEAGRRREGRRRQVSAEVGERSGKERQRSSRGQVP